MNDIPRRVQIDQFSPAETAIFNAVKAVEDGPPDTRLTQAVILLQRAREWVADFVDGIETERYSPYSDVPRPKAPPAKPRSLTNPITADRMRTLIVQMFEELKTVEYERDPPPRVIAMLNEAQEICSAPWPADEPTARPANVPHSSLPFDARFTVLCNDNCTSYLEWKWFVQDMLRVPLCKHIYEWREAFRYECDKCGYISRDGASENRSGDV